MTPGGKTSIQGSANKGKIQSDYESVTEQAGIYAGEGGFDIEVGGNTDLKGAVIASEATPDKNKISTDTLTYSDIQNEAEYEASSSGIGYSSDKGFSPSQGMPVSGDADSTTKSAISPGTIIVGGKEVNPDNLSRDPSGALNALDKIFDKKTVQEKQELANLFGEVAFNAIGDLATKQYKKAVDDAAKAKNAGNKEAYDEAMQRMALWDEGGTNKILLHAVAGGIMSSLSGNGFSTGAASAGLNEAVQKELGKIKDAGLHQLASAIVGATAAEIVGGNAQAGASTAVSGTKNNWLASGHETLLGQLKGNFSNEDIVALVAASEDADKLKNQGNNALHAMPECKLEDIKAEFQKNMQYAIDLENQNQHEEALHYLGYALHTAQDYYSHYSRGLLGGSLFAHEQAYVNPLLISSGGPDNPQNKPEIFEKAKVVTSTVADIFARGVIEDNLVNDIFKPSSVLENVFGK